MLQPNISTEMSVSLRRKRRLVPGAAIGIGQDGFVAGVGDRYSGRRGRMRISADAEDLVDAKIAKEEHGAEGHIKHHVVPCGMDGMHVILLLQRWGIGVEGPL